MSRTSNNEYKDGLLFNGYDYTNQAWVVNGVYVKCGHPETMNCNCFGKVHAGLVSIERESIESTESNAMLALEQESARLARSTRNMNQRIARRIKNEAMRSMGLTRVKGALGGTYWE